jgi:purine-binding chemotaxis protein CheW
MTDTNLDQILAKRQTARKEIVNVDEPLIKLVIFALGEDWFAFHGERIREILTKASIFFVPGCPGSLEGVINVRGDIESVIRLNELLQVPLPEPGTPSAILLGSGTAMNSGIRIDRVVDLVDIPQSFIQPPPANLPDQMRPFVSGLLRFKERPVSVLDLEQIFSQYVKGLG